MKLLKFGAVAAVLATMSLVGCSSADKTPDASDKSSSISFHLKTSSGVQISTVNYDLTATPGGADVVKGALPVPDDQSTNIPLLGISSLGAGNYALEFTATSTDGKYTCDSGKVPFALAASQNLTLPTITLQCTTTVQVDTTGSVTADVTVTTSEQSVGSVIETFAYGPRTANGQKQGTSCVFAPITLNIANSDTTIAYSWAASPDGTFTLNAANTQGTYNCASGGSKTLTLTGVKGGQTSTKQITVSCNDAACSFVCGNGILEGSEQCDENTPRCTNPSTGLVDCVIHPVCGDGKVDAPEQCDAVNLPTSTCDSTCHTIVAQPVCGDGVVNQASEQCDNGVNNSDTAPNACRTNCKSASCGDGVVDTGEQCDAGPTGSSTCDTTCKTISAPPHVACVACIEASADGSFQAGNCDGDSKCVAVENCAIDNKCFSPTPGLCYCGTTDITACSAGTFTPTGACVSEIKAGEGPQPDNSTYLQGFFDPGNSTGIAMLILSDLPTNAAQCTSLCY